jgi:hypothetical protein
MVCLPRSVRRRNQASARADHHGGRRFDGESGLGALRWLGRSIARATGVGGRVHRFRELYFGIGGTRKRWKERCSECFPMAVARCSQLPASWLHSTASPTPRHATPRGNGRDDLPAHRFGFSGATSQPLDRSMPCSYACERTGSEAIDGPDWT